MLVTPKPAFFKKSMIRGQLRLAKDPTPRQFADSKQAYRPIGAGDGPPHRTIIRTMLDIDNRELGYAIKHDER